MDDKDLIIQENNKIIDNLTARLLEKELECQQCRKDIIKYCRNKKK